MSTIFISYVRTRARTIQLLLIWRRFALLLKIQTITMYDGVSHMEWYEENVKNFTLRTQHLQQQKTSQTEMSCTCVCAVNKVHYHNPLPRHSPSHRVHAHLENVFGKFDGALIITSMALQHTHYIHYMRT